MSVKKLSSYQKLKNKVKELTKRNNDYYKACYNARQAVGSNEVCGFDSFLGSEESIKVHTVESLTEIIMNLP